MQKKPWFIFRFTFIFYEGNPFNLHDPLLQCLGMTQIVDLVYMYITNYIHAFYLSTRTPVIEDSNEIMDLWKMCLLLSMGILQQAMFVW